MNTKDYMQPYRRRCCRSYKLVHVESGICVPLVGGKMLTPNEAMLANTEYVKMGMGLAWIEKSRIKNDKVVLPPERR